MGFPPSEQQNKTRHAETPVGKGETASSVIDLSLARKARQSGDIRILNRPFPGRNPGEDAPVPPEAA